MPLFLRFSQWGIPITRAEREEPRFLDQYDKTGGDAVKTQATSDWHSGVLSDVRRT
jgi:hypothetical protein